MNDPYALLNLPRTASLEEIQQAYARERARQIAEAGESAVVEETLRLLDEAYQILADPTRRAALDQQSGASTALVPTLAPGARAYEQLPMTVTAPASAASILPEQICPHCGGQNPGRATLCLQCGRQMSRPCPQCGYPVGLQQAACPRCQTIVAEYDHRRFAESYAVEQQVRQARQETAARAEAADHLYKARVRMTTVFWLVVVGLCVAVAFLVPFLTNVIGG